MALMKDFHMCYLISNCRFIDSETVDAQLRGTLDSRAIRLSNTLIDLIREISNVIKHRNFGWIGTRKDFHLPRGPFSILLSPLLSN